MNQRKLGTPQANAMNQRRNQPAGNQQPHKPGVMQPKLAMTAQLKKQPVAPPAYRPQAVAKAAQPKVAIAAQSRNPTGSLQPGNRGLQAANAGTGQVRPAATPIQMKNAVGRGASPVSQRGGVIQRICGKCGSPSHAKKACTATEEQKAAYLFARMSHGNHGKDRPKKHIAKSKVKSMAAVTATVNK